MLNRDKLQAIQHGTPEGIAAAIKRAGEHQLAIACETTPETPKAPPHFVGVYWRHFWNGQRFTRTHLFRDYPERGYQNADPSEGKTLCGETIPDYYRTVDPRCSPCKRCARIAARLLEQEAS